MVAIGAPDPVGKPHELPAGWQVVMAAKDHHLFKRAEALEYETFVTEGFCMAEPHHRVVSYDRWRDQSTFHVALEGDDVKGVIRCIIGTFEDLPIGHFKITDDVPPDPLCEYASLAIGASARSFGVAEALYRSVWQHALRESTSGLVAIAEEWLLDLLRDHYGFGFHAVGPAEWYMGGDCLPIVASHAEIVERLPSERPGLLRYLLHRLHESGWQTLSDQKISTTTVGIPHPGQDQSTS